MVFDALKRASTTDKAAVIRATAAMGIDSIVGPIRFNAQHDSVQPLGMGQWQQDPASKRRTKK